jgi:hypothetical protein
MLCHDDAVESCPTVARFNLASATSALRQRSAAPNKHAVVCVVVGVAVALVDSELLAEKAADR